ncbi:MAG: hypothetical protein JXA94_00840 [Parachlamydiales bacterium]|nr:hypothetical protein [Parachlamydiales bacterium]
MNNYNNLIKKFFSKYSKKSKLDLKSISLADSALNQVSKKFKSIHIAGTNGKGSTSLKIATALSMSNYKTALFTSPHISKFEERIQIDGKKIKRDDVCLYLKRMDDLQKQIGIDLTFFEITALIAFSYFADNNVDFAVIETGLGGRLDATNIISPILTVITSISLDHQNVLGDTLDKIANEKAGIIKPKIPLVAGPTADLEPIRKKAKDLSCYLKISKQTDGFFDDQNSLIAEDALNILSKNYTITKEAIKKAMKTRPTCRFEVFDKIADIPVVFDVSHNEAGFLELKKALLLFFPNKEFRLILGFSKDKDVNACVKIIKTFAKHIHIVQSANSRAMKSEIIEEYFMSNNFFNFSLEKNIKFAVEHSLKISKNKNEVLVVCGSFYIMNDVKTSFKI